MQLKIVDATLVFIQLLVIMKLDFRVQLINGNFSLFNYFLIKCHFFQLYQFIILFIIYLKCQDSDRSNYSLLIRVTNVLFVNFRLVLFKINFAVK